MSVAENISSRAQIGASWGVRKAGRGIWNSLRNASPFGSKTTQPEQTTSSQARSAVTGAGKAAVGAVATGGGSVVKSIAKKTVLSKWFWIGLVVIIFFFIALVADYISNNPGAPIEYVLCELTTSTEACLQYQGERVVDTNLRNLGVSR